MSDLDGGARPRCGRARPAGLDRDAGQSAVGRSPTSRRSPRSRTRPARVLAVDSTVATPVLTRPLALGADIVMHSATKYLNGHSDVIAGALATARQDDALGAASPMCAAQHGAILGPFEAWLLLRGMRTLRCARRGAQRDTARDARRRDSAAHPAGRRVLYPGLPRHPGHARRGAADERRLRRHAVDPGEGRRARRDRRGGARRSVEARDLARRRRKPDRASRLGRGARLAVPARSAAAVGRDWKIPRIFTAISTAHCAPPMISVPDVRRARARFLECCGADDRMAGRILILGAAGRLGLAAAEAFMTPAGRW